MKFPSRWIEDDTATGLEREVLESGREDAPPPAAEADVWRGLVPFLGPPPGGPSGLDGSGPLGSSGGGGGAAAGGGAATAGGAAAGGGAATAGGAAAGGGAVASAAGGGSVAATAAVGGGALAAGGGAVGGGALMKGVLLGFGGGVLVTGAVSLGTSESSVSAPAPIESAAVVVAASATPRPETPLRAAQPATSRDASPAPRGARAVRRGPVPASSAPPGEAIATFPELRAESALPGANAALPTTRADLLREEARLMQQARAASQAGDLGRGFALLESARVRFPAGALAQEREVLTTELLARSGQHAAARQRAAAFVAQYPTSPHVARMQRLLEQ